MALTPPRWAGGHSAVIGWKWSIHTVTRFEELQVCSICMPSVSPPTGSFVAQISNLGQQNDEARMFQSKSRLFHAVRPLNATKIVDGELRSRCGAQLLNIRLRITAIVRKTGEKWKGRTHQWLIHHLRFHPPSTLKANV